MAETTEAAAGAGFKTSLARVLRNRNLRRIQLAFGGSVLGDWAYATALTVWAFHDGGATAVGLFQTARFLGMAVAGPIGSVVADKVPRKSFMMSLDATRATLVAAAAVCVGAGAPSASIYVIGFLAAIVGAPFRSAQAGLIPRLVSAPDELTASNAVAANLENVVIFCGPALGALLVGLTNVEVVFWLNVATFGWSLLMVAGVRVPAVPVVPVVPAVPSTSEASADGVADGGGNAEPETKAGFLSELSAGFTTVARDADLRRVSLLAAAQGFVWGALTVFTVVIAVKTLDAGPQGVGYLDAVMGGGTILGGAIILTRIAKGRLARDMVVGVLGWSLPLLLMAAWVNPLAAFVGLAVIGLMDPWVNLGFETIPQRIAPDRVLSRVYAAVEAALIGAMSLGALLAPAMIAYLGFRPSLALIGVVVTVYALSCLPRMRDLDGRLAAPVGVDVLRGLALFAPLTPPTVETLARKLQPVSASAGAVILTEGESSDRFYIIRSGEVEVTQGGAVLRHETAGDFFGEIGLLRDVPRTATITAVTDTELWALERADFLAAVTGQQEARVAAEEIVSRRLGV